MSAEKKVKRRPYTSAVRRRRAAATRSRIGEAASALFLEHGYVATSIDAIARAAGVSRRTVFLAFGSKAALLGDAVERSVAGATGTPDAIEAEVDRVRRETDPVALVRAHAAVAARVAARVMPLLEVLDQAAAVDPEVKALRGLEEQRRLEGVGWIADLLAARGALRSDLTAAEAKERMWLAYGPASYRLANERGWPPGKYEQWLGDVFVGILLPIRSSSP